MFRQITLSTLLVGVCATAHAATTVTLKNAKNEDVGTAILTPLTNGVKIDVSVHGLPPGEHGFHIHETGSCLAPKFESAGGHFAPGKNAHGFDAHQGPHAGDMANLVVGADGSAKLEVVNTRVTLGKGANSLAKKGGTALMVHEKADDYKTQPTGNAGGRLACGEIKGEG